MTGHDWILLAALGGFGCLSWAGCVVWFAVYLYGPPKGGRIVDGPNGDDMGWAGLWGGLVAGGGAIARGVQKPQTWRVFVGVVLTGVLFGSIATASVLWYYPTVPVPLAVLLGGGVGWLSADLSQLVLKIVEGFFVRIVKTIDKKADQLGLEKGDSPNGPDAAPAAARPGSAGAG